MRTAIIELEGKKLLVLNGLSTSEDDIPIDQGMLDELLSAMKKDPDAIAFGRIEGKWVAAA